MKTFKMLDISTGHLSQQDVNLLEDTENLSFTCVSYEEGFFINLSLFETNLPQMKQEEQRFSPEFFKIIKAALKEGCTHINFDRDGEEYEEFTKFEW